MQGPVSTNHKPRPFVVEQLCQQALDAMDDDTIPDLLPSEVLSAAFTLTSYIIEALLNNTTGEEREHNIEEIRTAIGKIYEPVAQKVAN